ncbi:Aminopeptidase YwaD [Thalassocella blandensis]|nr:Aminopeptidase YwaD [Thalassocella blandensis]
MLNRAITWAITISVALHANTLWAYEFSQEQLQTAQELRELAEDDKLGYQIVESLTTEIGPRLAGSPAEKRAREWATDTLKSLGFKNIRVEEFELPYWQRHHEHAEIISPFPQPLVISALGGSTSTPEGGVQGEVVRFDSLAGLQAAKDGSLKNKIVFIDETMARTQDGSGYGAAVAKRRLTAYESHRAGALAALIRSVGTDHDRFAHTGQMKRVTDKDIGESVPTAALSAPDADQLRRIMSKINKPVELKLTLTTSTQPATTSGNVIAELPGKQNKDEIVLVGAHLDSWDLGTGAIDDGAGIGIIVAAAKLVHQHVKRPLKRTIRIVMFGSEEVGLVGAKAYAQKHAKDQHIIAAESDFGADIIWQFGVANASEDHSQAVDALAKVFRPMDIIPTNGPVHGGPDIKYLREDGVPTAEFLQNGKDYFDLHHTANDTLDKINKEKLRQNIAAYAQFLYLVADSDIKFK